MKYPFLKEHHKERSGENFEANPLWNHYLK